ncbi:MAG: PTS transporter subunit IIC [Bacillota bacterium]
MQEEKALTIGKRTLNYLIKTLNGMALGLFSTLIIGVIIEQIGVIFASESIQDLAAILKSFMGVGIGVGIAWSLDLKGLPLISGAVAGGIATQVSNDPVVAYVTSVAAMEGLRLILRKKTPVDILLIPMISATIAFAVANLIGQPVALFMQGIGEFINTATTYQPLFMGIIIAAVMGMALTAPISSAAIAISIGLSGIAGGAAVVGGATQMLGFAVMARKDNSIGGVLSIAIGTSMLQFKNILKKPVIWLPPIIVSALIGPLSTMVFKLESTPIGSGMGTAALIGQIGVLDAMGYEISTFIGIAIIHVILPITLIVILDYAFRKKGLFIEGDFKL